MDQFTNLKKRFRPGSLEEAENQLHENVGVPIENSTKAFADKIMSQARNPFTQHARPPEVYPPNLPTAQDRDAAALGAGGVNDRLRMADERIKKENAAYDAAHAEQLDPSQYALWNQKPEAQQVAQPAPRFQRIRQLMPAPQPVAAQPTIELSDDPEEMQRQIDAAHKGIQNLYAR